MEMHKCRLIYLDMHIVYTFCSKTPLPVIYMENYEQSYVVMRISSQKTKTKIDTHLLSLAVSHFRDRGRLTLLHSEMEEGRTNITKTTQHNFELELAV